MTRNPQVIAFMTPFPYSIDVDAPRIVLARLS